MTVTWVTSARCDDDTQTLDESAMVRYVRALCASRKVEA